MRTDPLPIEPTPARHFWWGLAGFLLIILILLVSSILLILFDVGRSEAVLMDTASVRTGVQRYVTLELAHQPRLADSVAAEIEDRFAAIGMGPVRSTPLDREQRAFLDSWSKLLPVWREIRGEGIAFRRDPSPARMESLVTRSEAFGVSRKIVSLFVGDIQNTRSLLVLIMALLGAVLVIGVGILRS
ncbi:MAG: hypothetical protein J0L75_06635 [Spirochaetes bacterium]|nr:hypothetical protein [Spirochaetota bacterium]